MNACDKLCTHWSPGAWSPVAMRLILCVLCLWLVACSRSTDTAETVGEVSGHGSRAVERHQFVGPPPLPIETRDGDYKIAAGGYADYVRDGFRPRPDLDAYVISLPLDWRVDPFKDNNWRFQLQAWRMLNPMWGEYRKAGSGEVLEEILKVVRDWHRFHVAEARNSSYQWQDMATGLRAQHIAYLNRLVATGKWTPGAEDSQMLRTLSDLHARKLHDETFISINNHGIFQVHGLRLLCNSAPELDACRGETAFSSGHMGRLIENQFDEGGVHREDSSFYHLFAYKTFRGIRMSLYPGVPRGTTKRIRLAEGVTPWLTGLDGNLLQFGDSEGVGAPFGRPSDAGRCWSITKAGQCVVARDLHENGYVSVRSHPDEDVNAAFQFFVVGSSHDAGHDHVDELSFLLSHRGTPIFVDGGKYGYQDDAYRDYFVSDRAHSLVGLDGMSFRPEQTVGEGSYLDRFSEQDGQYEVSGEVRRGDDFVHGRTFLYTPQSVLEIVDQVEKPASARLELRYIVSPKLDVAEIDGDGFEVSRADGSKLATISLPGAERCDAAIVRGRRAPDYTGWISTSYLTVEPTTNLIVKCPEDVDAIKTFVQLH